MSFFDEIKGLPEDPILSLPIHFAADPRSLKVNLGIGSYKDSAGKPFIFSCVREAEKQLASMTLNKEYPPIEGVKEYIKPSLSLIFGDTQPTSVVGIQTIGGTGAIRLGCEFLLRNHFKRWYLPDPTWPNHFLVLGLVDAHIHSYPYYNGKNHQLEFDLLCESIKRMPARSILLLHASCHNPTGLDPSSEQWRELSRLILHQGVLPFFDLAYQGIGDGLTEDAYAVRLFAEQGHEMFVASSNSKNFGLYGERLGMLSVVCRDKNGGLLHRMASQLKRYVRGLYSMPPLHGARVAALIMNDPQLRNTWLQELASLRLRLHNMRTLFVQGMEKHGYPASFLLKQKGLFSYFNLSEEKVQQLREQDAIYMAPGGRINVAGLTEENLNYVTSRVSSKIL